MDSMAVVAAFRTIAPAYETKTDEEVLSGLAFVVDMVSEKRFGKRTEKALAALIAHLFAMEDTISAEGATGSSSTAGGVKSEREGDLERTYSDDVSGSNTDLDSWLKRTAYGRLFLAIRAMCIIPVMTRMG